MLPTYQLPDITMTLVKIIETKHLISWIDITTQWLMGDDFKPAFCRDRLHDQVPYGECGRTVNPAVMSDVGQVVAWENILGTKQRPVPSQIWPTVWRFPTMAWELPYQIQFIHNGKPWFLAM